VELQDAYFSFSNFFFVVLEGVAPYFHVKKEFEDLSLDLD
jgi:hypothetical protein